MISKRENSKIGFSAVDNNRIEQLETEKQWFKIELEKAKETIKDNASANLRLSNDL